MSTVRCELVSIPRHAQISTKQAYTSRMSASQKPLVVLSPLPRLNRGVNGKANVTTTSKAILPSAYSLLLLARLRLLAFATGAPTSSPTDSRCARSFMRPRRLLPGTSTLSGNSLPIIVKSCW